MVLTPKNDNMQSPLEDKQEEYWWFGGSTTDEEITPSEYDVGGLDLGAESPQSNNSTTNLLEHVAYVKQWAETGLSVPRVLERTPSWSSFGKRRHRPDSAKEDDRDCGICFEYAVRPCRTLCCGKIFCTEHLADWLHGPNAEGRCPNCENACSLEGSTLSLSSPLFKPTSQSPPGKRHTPLPDNHGVFHPSPLAVVQPRSNHTLEDQRTSMSELPTHSTSTSLSSDRDHTISSIDEDAEKHPYPHPYVKGGLAQLGSASASAMNLSSTTPFSSSWGALSRLMSIITFLMFIYKLLS